MTLASNGLQNAVVYRWAYADAATRTAATGFVSTDVGALALQQSDNTLWMLTATTPTWVQALGISTLTVDEVDGTPSVANVTHLTVSNGTLTDNGGGHVTVTTGGGGGGGGGMVEKVAQATLASDGFFDFSSLDLTTYETAELHLTHLASSSDSPDPVDLQCNGDTGANYVSLQTGGAITTSDTKIYLGTIPGSGDGLSHGASVRASIGDPGEAAGRKYVIAEIASVATGDLAGRRSTGGKWQTASAITRLVIKARNGTLLAGARCTIYGYSK